MRRFNWGFYAALALWVLLWAGVTYSTRNAVAADGSILFGFPTPFATYSCWPVHQVNEPNCGYEFRVPMLLADLLLAAAVLWFAHFAVARWARSRRVY